MINKRFLAVLLVAFFSSFGLSHNYANAGLSNSVSCLQSQLNHAGFDAGPVDGLLGSKTRNALEAYQAANGQLSQRSLDLVSAPLFCRLIGLQDSEMVQFWPSKVKGQFSLITSQGFNAELKARLETSARKARARSLAFAARPAGHDLLLAAENQTDLKKLVREHVDIPLADLTATVGRACGTSRGISAQALPGVILFCAPDRQAITTEWMDFLVAHEFVHLVQFQLGGALPVEAGEKARLNAEGPAWLFEGVAQAFGNKTALKTPDWDFRIVNYRRLNGELPDLSELELASTARTRRSDVYRAGTVGAVDLIDLYDYATIFEFYDNLGRGTDWEDAFFNAFGITPTQFYSHYNSVQRFSASGEPLLGPLTEYAGD